jgi:hypothetical protein
VKRLATKTLRAPHFKLGDTVREKMPFFIANETGVVVQTYPLDGQYRCVVKFDGGREAVYFETELNRIEI